MAFTSLIYLRQAFSITPQVRFMVTRGPYAIVRHPMYVGHIISLFGLALLKGSILALAIWTVCAALQMWRAVYEEDLLTRTLPRNYDAYSAKVGAFLPKF
ncbi:MAG: isoprenylcysteine carboxylmethyltransferase family protein [Pseudomonadota bacterium]